MHGHWLSSEQCMVIVRVSNAWQLWGEQSMVIIGNGWKLNEQRRTVRLAGHTVGGSVGEVWQS